MKPCPDCKATPGLYVGLFQTEKCKTCDGTALVPEVKQAPAPKPFDPSDYFMRECVCNSECQGVYFAYTEGLRCNVCYKAPPEYLQHEQVRFTVGFPTQRDLSDVGPMWCKTGGHFEPWYGPDSWNVFDGAEYATPGPQPTDALPLVHLETVEEFRALAAHFKIEIVE